MSDFTIINDAMGQQLIILNKHGNPVRTLFGHEPDYKHIYDLYMVQQANLFRTQDKEVAE